MVKKRHKDIVEKHLEYVLDRRYKTHKKHRISKDFREEDRDNLTKIIQDNDERGDSLDYFMPKRLNRAEKEDIRDKIIKRYTDIEDKEDIRGDPSRQNCEHYVVNGLRFKIAYDAKSMGEIKKNVTSQILLENLGIPGYSPIIDWGPSDNHPYYIVMLEGNSLSSLLSEGNIEASHALTDFIGEYMFSPGRVKKEKKQALYYTDYLAYTLIERAESLEFLEDRKREQRVAKLRYIRKKLPGLIPPEEFVCWGFEDAISSNFIYFGNKEDISYKNIKVIDQGYTTSTLNKWRGDVGLNEDDFVKFKEFKLPHFQLYKLLGSMSEACSGHEPPSKVVREEIHAVFNRFLRSGNYKFHDEELINKKLNTNYWARTHRANVDVFLNIIAKLGNLSFSQHQEKRGAIGDISDYSNEKVDQIIRLLREGVLQD